MAASSVIIGRLRDRRDAVRCRGCSTPADVPHLPHQEGRRSGSVGVSSVTDAQDLDQPLVVVHAEDDPIGAPAG